MVGCRCFVVCFSLAKDKEIIMNSKLVQWVLRIAIAGEFVGHGVFALQGKADWIKWIQQFGVTDVEMATNLLFAVGVLDVAFGLFILWKMPSRALLLAAAVWAFWTALVRPLTGMPIWDFVERWANWGAPLALLLTMGWPRSSREWFSFRIRK